MAVSPTTQRKLSILSGNKCAFPGCRAPILDTDHHVIVGQACHIKAKSPRGPRYDPDQSPEERDGFDNLILMCAAHNTVIDDPESAAAFPVDMLREFKQKHEAQFHNTVVVTEPVVEELMKLLWPIRIQWENEPSLVPIVESQMTGADNQLKIDRYDFKVRFRNEGKKTVRNFRLEVRIPNAFRNPSLSSHAEVRQHNRGDVALYRHTDEAFLGKFVLYPGEISHQVIMLDYQIRHDQYQDLELDTSAAIAVTIYSHDEELSYTNHPIAAYRNKDRMDQLGLSS